MILLNDFYKCFPSSALPKFGLFKHPYRKCIYHELDACVDLGKGNILQMTDQVEYYRKKGMPAKYGLPATALLIRKHNDHEVKEVDDAWAQHLSSGSLRDQLSLPFIFWSKSFNPDWISGNIFWNRFVFHFPHKHNTFYEKVKWGLKASFYHHKYYLEVIKTILYK